MNKNNMHVMVLFLLVIATTISSVLCSSSNNDDKEILMVVEEQTSSMQSQMDQNQVQPAPRFGIKGGRSVTLSWLVNGRENYCVPPNGDPCGALDHCCEGLYCNGIFSGECLPLTNCRSKGAGCNMLYECCYPNKCTSTTLWQGVCE